MLVLKLIPESVKVIDFGGSVLLVDSMELRGLTAIRRGTSLTVANTTANAKVLADLGIQYFAMEQVA